MALVFLHLLSSSLALLLGALTLFSQKGSSRHRRYGTCYVALMVISATSSFPLGEDYSPLHGLSVWVLLCMIVAVASITRRSWHSRLKIRLHRGFMIGSYLGLWIAFIGSLHPERLVGHFLFGG